MGETDETKTGTPPAAGQSSEVTKESTSKQIPDTYSKEQTLKLISDALAEQGRKHKAELDPILKERESLKSQLQIKDNDLSAISEEREKIEQQLKDLAKNDPEAFNLIKFDKELREKERKLKADREVAEADWKAKEERVKLAESTHREITIWEISAEFESGDPVKLKDLCDVFEANSEEQVRKIAETIWMKKLSQSPPATPPVKPYSGMTSGGGVDFNSLTPDEKLKYAFQQIKKK